MAQTYQDFEIIIVDDASLDETEKMIYEKFGEYINIGKIKHLRNEKNMERSYSRNRGIREATGRYIAFLDDDDVWLPNHLNILVKFMDKHPSIGLSFSTAIRLHEGVPKKVPEGLKEGFGKIYRDECFYGRVGVLQCSIFRSEVLIKIGNFREDMNRGEDTELFTRVAANYDIGYLENVTCLAIRETRDEPKKLYYSKLKVLQAIEENIYKFAYEPSQEIASLLYLRLSEHFVKDDLDKARTYLQKAIKKNKGLLSKTLTWKLLCRTVIGNKLYNFLKKLSKRKQ